MQSGSLLASYWRKMKRPIKIVAWANSSGSSYWRLKDPFYFLNKSGKFDARVTNEGISKEILEWGDIFITQGTVDKNGLALIYEYQQEHGKKWICESDDHPAVGEDNPFKLNHDIANAREVITISMGAADMITCSTPYLANELKQYNDNIVVLPNYMNMERWDIKPKIKNTSDRIRILWAGSVTHMKDVELLVDAVKKIHDEFKNVDFYFVGDIRMSTTFKDIERAEFMLGTDFLAWPSKLWGIRADIGLAPLQDALFTRCKSPIKAYEYGINEIPCILSDVEPYKSLSGYEGVTIVQNNWYDAMKELILNRELRVSSGEKLYKRIKEEMNLSKHISKWSDTYKSLL